MRFQKGCCATGLLDSEPPCGQVGQAVRRPVSLAAVLLSSSPWDTRRLRRPGGQGRAWKPHAERSPQGEHRTGGVRGLRTLGRLAGVAYGPNKGDKSWRTARKACRHRWSTPRGERICAGCRPAPGIRTSAGQPARSAVLRGWETTRVGQRAPKILRCSKNPLIMDPSPPPSLVDFKAQALAWAFFLSACSMERTRFCGHHGHAAEDHAGIRDISLRRSAPAAGAPTIAAWRKCLQPSDVHGDGWPSALATLILACGLGAYGTCVEPWADAFARWAA